MEQQGILRNWNNEKGFGFIKGAQGDVFVHISAVRGDTRPEVNAEVFYIAKQDQQGRWRATHMRGTELAIDKPKIRRKPHSQPVPQKHQPQTKFSPRAHAGTGKDAAWKALLFFVSIVITAWGLVVLLLHNALLWPMGVYMGASLISFIQYWTDKNKAQTDEWRTPESSLHLIELLGGWPGAFIAQKLLRHKTRKGSYQATYWLIVLIHLAFWIDTLFLGQHAIAFVGWTI